MINNRIITVVLCLILCITFQSCSKDSSIESDLIEFRGSEDGRGGRGDGQGGGQGNDDQDGPSGQENGENLPVSALENDILDQWTDLLLELERYAAGRPCAAARALAYIYLAAYETAVPGMPAYSTTSSQFPEFTISNLQRPEDIDWELALNRSFATAIDHFLLDLPRNRQDEIRRLERRIEDRLERGVSQNIRRSSREWGEYVTRQVIAFSQTDEEGEEQATVPQPRSYEPPVADGYWTYSADEERALYPYWESVRTFVVAPSQTTTVPPLAYSENPSNPYYKQMQEVYDINNQARANQGEELYIAEFWSDDVEGLMMSPPARQISISNQLIDQYRLNLEEALVLFLKVGFSLNDAAVSTWKYKYEHMVMRPSVFIHEHIDPAYQTNLYRLIYWPNPSFPGYPSGHSCFASAAAGVFIDTFGDETSFTDNTHEGREEFLGAPRTFSTFSHLAEENAYSRIPLGVHVRMDCDEGLRLGYEIANAINDLDLLAPTP